MQVRQQWKCIAWRDDWCMVAVAETGRHTCGCVRLRVTWPETKSQPVLRVRNRKVEHSSPWKNLNSGDKASKAMSSTRSFNKIVVGRTRVWSHAYNVQQGCDVALLSRIPKVPYPWLVLTLRSPPDQGGWNVPTCLKTRT